MNNGKKSNEKKYYKETNDFKNKELSLELKKEVTEQLFSILGEELIAELKENSIHILLISDKEILDDGQPNNIILEFEENTTKEFKEKAEEVLSINMDEMIDEFCINTNLLERRKFKKIKVGTYTIESEAILELKDVYIYN
jgi:hypothetical protein